MRFYDIDNITYLKKELKTSKRREVHNPAWTHGRNVNNVGITYKIWIGPTTEPFTKFELQEITERLLFTQDNRLDIMIDYENIPKALLGGLSEREFIDSYNLLAFVTEEDKPYYRDKLSEYRQAKRDYDRCYYTYICELPTLIDEVLTTLEHIIKDSYENAKNKIGNNIIKITNMGRLKTGLITFKFN